MTLVDETRQKVSLDIDPVEDVREVIQFVRLGFFDSKSQLYLAVHPNTHVRRALLANLTISDEVKDILRKDHKIKKRYNWEIILDRNNKPQMQGRSRYLRP